MTIEQKLDELISANNAATTAAMLVVNNSLISVNKLSVADRAKIDTMTGVSMQIAIAVIQTQAMLVNSIT